MCAAVPSTSCRFRSSQRSQDTIKTRAQTAAPGAFAGPMDIARQTIRKEGFLALYKGPSPSRGGMREAGADDDRMQGWRARCSASRASTRSSSRRTTMRASSSARSGRTCPSDRSPWLARWLVRSRGALFAGREGGWSGADQSRSSSVLASPVEMFKIRMQGQYGEGGKRLRDVVGDMYRQYGWRKGIMRGYWVRLAFRPSHEVAADALDFRSRLSVRSRRMLVRVPMPAGVDKSADDGEQDSTPGTSRPSVRSRSTTAPRRSPSGRR